MKRQIATIAATATALVALTAPSVGTASATYELNIGSLAPVGTPWRTLLENAETQIEEGSGGKINVILRPAGLMGEVELVRETRSAERIQGCAVTTGALAQSR